MAAAHPNRGRARRCAGECTPSDLRARWFSPGPPFRSLAHRWPIARCARPLRPPVAAAVRLISWVEWVMMHQAGVTGIGPQRSRIGALDRRIIAHGGELLGGHAVDAQPAAQ